MTSTFVHRRINVSFSMGGGQTGATTLTNSTLQGLRVSARITKTGLGESWASLQIYGMTLDQMNQLSQIGAKDTQVKRNTVMVQAGDDQNGMSTVFKGNIVYAWPDMTNQPQVVFRVEAMGGQFDAVKPIKETSFKGPTPFATIAQSIVGKMSGVSFQNSGVQATINNPYFYGSALRQFEALAKAANAAWDYDNETTMAAWPMNQSRQGGGSSVVSRQTGMVADPVGASNGRLIVKRLFDRDWQFGTQFTVQCIIDQANGTWTISRLDYSLESEMPHGQWFMTIEGYNKQ